MISGLRDIDIPRNIHRNIIRATKLCFRRSNLI